MDFKKLKKSLLKYACAKLWNEFFVRGIAIDSDRSHNISLSEHPEYGKQYFL